MRRAAWTLAVATLAAAATAAAQGAEEPTPQEGADTPGGQPPAHYYVEPSEPAAGRPARGPAQPPPQGGPPQGVYEPPPPGYGPGYYPVYEPPPPPKPKHVAPKTALWAGARIGWFIPFGNLWADRLPSGDFEGHKWSRYASAGPMFELDVGARLGRYYNLFLLWERAQLGAGSEEIPALGAQEGGDTDFYALGLRVSSEPDKVGFLTEINLGYRRFRARFEDGSELRLTEAPLEFRLGLGADIRLSRAFSLSPLLTFGVGAFGDAEWSYADGSTASATDQSDEQAGHGWLTLQLGGHFDLFGAD